MDFILGVPTFFVHLTFLRRLECLIPPNLNISSVSWHSLVRSLLVEWSDSNLLVRSFPLERLRFLSSDQATVVLSANMAFLALGGITWPAVVCSIVSTFCSIGSIVIGVHHVWTHRKYLEAAPEVRKLFLP